jgi:lysophospholipase L1-like esterase
MNKTSKLLLVISIVAIVAAAYASYKAIMYRTYINYWLEKYKAVVAEFSGREVYTEENESIKSAVRVPGRIVFIGTQVTRSWDLKRHFDGYDAINRGIVGQRVSGFVLRFVPDVIELGPQAVVIEISSYNFRPQWPVKETQDFAAQMADLARGHDIRPILATVIPPRKGAENLGPYVLMDSLAAFNHWLRGYCETQKITCIDFERLLAGADGCLREELSLDGIDPNEEGYRVMSAAVRQALDSLP